MNALLMAMLLGAGAGFLEDEIETCPCCGCDFSMDEITLVYDERACPCCLEPLSSNETAATNRDYCLSKES